MAQKIREWIEEYMEEEGWLRNKKNKKNSLEWIEEYVEEN